MRRALLLVILLAASLTAFGQSKVDPADEMRKLPWVTAPESGRIGDQATMRLDDKHLFLGEQGTSRFLELSGNPPRGGHYALVPKEGEWFAVFSFKADGYVRDDEKIDADALLKSLKESDGPANEERKRLGMPPMHTDGWHVPPHYDASTKRLEWGLRLRDDAGRPVINYMSRILGRDGVMSAILVTDPQSLDADMAAFRKAMTGFDYNSGKRYSEFRDGDKVAAYGLGALVLGGAAAAAVKSKGFLKMILLGALAFGGAAWAGLRRFFSRKPS